MKPIKLIVTNKSKLQEKYGRKISTINRLLKQMRVADKKKGLDTRIAFVDDAASLKSFGVKRIASDTAMEYKRVIDDLYKKYIPAYIVILGAQDIIPFQEITNPAEDEDLTVPSDLPYACNTAFSKKIESFTGPTRVVGRIPDIPGQQKNAAYLERLIANAISHQPIQAEAYQKYFAVSAQVWNISTQLSLQSMFGQSHKLISSPKNKVNSKYKPYSEKQLEPLTHFYNCHGVSFDQNFYGEKGKQFPEALKSSNIQATIKQGTVVAAECCYGAQLFNATEMGVDGVSIATNYLANGAIAFVGSSNISYGPPDSQGLADLMTQYFIKNILKGASIGRAFLEARQQFLIEAGPDLDPIELKTIAQFYLLGDPSVQPARCEDAEVKLLSMGTAIANTRKNLFMKGIAIGDNVGVTKKQSINSTLKVKLQGQGEAVSINEILKKNKFKITDKSSVYAVKPKLSSDGNLQKKFGGKKVRFHTYIQDPKERLKKIRILVVKENAVQILGWRVYESK